MASTLPTQEQMIEARVAASSGTSLSVYAQDFSFGETMFESAKGNVEGLGGVSSGVSDIAVEERLKLENEERKKDDPAGDASMITELAARQREASQQIMIGSLALTRQEVGEINDFLQTNDGFEASVDHLIDQGMAPDQAREHATVAQRRFELENIVDRTVEQERELNNIRNNEEYTESTESIAEFALDPNRELNAQNAMALRLDIQSGTTSYPNALDSADSETRQVIRASLFRDNNLDGVQATIVRENEQAQEEIGFNNIEDQNFLSMMSSDASSTVMASPDRTGPVISDSFTQVAQNSIPLENALENTQDNLRTENRNIMEANL